MHENVWLPSTLYDFSDAKFAMHSANDFPHHTQFLELKMGYKYDLSFDRIKIKYLEAPYETNCMNYDLDSTDDYQMNAECLHHCYQKTMHQICSPCTNKSDHCCFILNSQMWPINWINKHNYGHLKYCNMMNCFYEMEDVVLNQCKLQCKQDCITRYYSVDEKLHDNSIVHLDIWRNLTYIRVISNEMPDHVTEHTPAMTFEDFFGTFGGTVGIWLGLSVIALFDYIIKHYNKIYHN